MKIRNLVATVSCVVLASCSSMMLAPYESSLEGIDISSSPNGSYIFRSYSKSYNLNNIKQSNLEFCMVQSVSLSGPNPVLSPSGNKIVTQGKEQAYFVIPRTMGTPLRYEFFYKLTTSIDSDSSRIIYSFDDLMLKGSWSNTANQFPGNSEAKEYVESAIERMDSVIEKINKCIVSF